MLHIYTFASQALENHLYNIQIQWYCWWVGNKKSRGCACRSFLFLRSAQGCGRHWRNVFGYSLYKVLTLSKTSLHILQSRCIATWSPTEAVFFFFFSFFSFLWIPLNIQKFLFPEFESLWREKKQQKRATEIKSSKKRRQRCGENGTEEVEETDTLFPRWTPKTFLMNLKWTGGLLLMHALHSWTWTICSQAGWLSPSKNSLTICFII